MGNCLGNVRLHSALDSDCSANSCDYCKAHSDTVRGRPELCYCAIPVSRFFKYVTKPVRPDGDTDSWMRDKPCYKWFTYEGMKVSYCENQCLVSSCCERLNIRKDNEDIVQRKLNVACNTRLKGNTSFSCYSKMKATEATLFPVTIIRCLTPNNCFVNNCQLPVSQ